MPAAVERTEVRRLADRLHDPSTYVDGVPLDDLARLRRDLGVVWVEEPPLLWESKSVRRTGPGYLLVLRHVDVRMVLADTSTYSSHRGGTQIRDPGSPDALRYVRRMMLNMDPPEHSRLRKLVAASFTPRAVSELEHDIAAHARRIVDAMIGERDHGECDFAQDVAADLPLLSLADILGVPTEDRWLMFDWSNRVIGFQDPDYASSAEFDGTTGTDLARQAIALRPEPDADGMMPDPRTREGMPDLYAYANLLGERKRADPGNDVMSILMAQRDDHGGQVSVEEFENMFWLFAVAGNETLRNGLPGGMLALLAHPDQQRLLRSSPDLLESAVEEMLRWWTPVMTFRRTAASAATIANRAVQAGDKVVVSFMSANRDENAFDDPDAFNIRRYSRRGTSRHLVFGYGPHFCLGAHLARVQMRALFGELLRRTRWIEPAGPPSYLRSNFQRGVKRLPIGWQS